MLGIISIACIKKRPCSRDNKRGPGTSKHCVVEEEAAIAAIIATIFLRNKEKEESMED